MDCLECLFGAAFPLSPKIIPETPVNNPGFRKCEGKNYLPKYVLRVETPINNAPPVV